MGEIGTATNATCGSCDWDADGFKLRCDNPAPYRADFRCDTHVVCGGSYSLALCVRHAAAVRDNDTLQRIYSA